MIRTVSRSLAVCLVGLGAAACASEPQLAVPDFAEDTESSYAVSLGDTEICIEGTACVPRAGALLDHGTAVSFTGPDGQPCSLGLVTEGPFTEFVVASEAGWPTLRVPPTDIGDGLHLAAACWAEDASYVLAGFTTGADDVFGTPGIAVDDLVAAGYAKL